MPRTNRLSCADFSLLLKAKTRRINGLYFTVSILPVDPHSPSRASCVVSKKVSKRAVDRNLIKRRAREVVRPLLSQVSSPALFMLYAKKESLTANFQSIEQDLSKIFLSLTD